MVAETIERSCLECGEEIKIELDTDGNILSEVEYYGETQIPIEDTGEWVQKDEAVVYDEDTPGLERVPREEVHEWDHHFGVTEWTGEYREVEHWVCEFCSGL